MPLNKNAIIRYVKLDEMLSNKYHSYSISDLTDGCNEYLKENGVKPVTKRCIELDLYDLEDIPFYADIERVKEEGKSIVRYKDASFSIFTKKLSDDEMLILSEALSTIGQFKGLANFSWLDGLKCIIGKKKSDKKIISFSNSSYLDYLPNRNLLGELFTAIANKQVINLHYHTFSNRTIKSILLYPYQLKQYNERWYLLGAAAEDGFILNFPLDRINGFESHLGMEYQECPEDLEERFDDIVGVTLPKNAVPENVLLWVDKKYYPYVKTKPLFDYQVEVSGDEVKELNKTYPNLTDGHFIRLNDIIINHELINLVLSHSFNMVWLAPKQFTLDGEKTSFGKIVSKMAKNYEVCE